MDQNQTKPVSTFSRYLAVLVFITSFVFGYFLDAILDQAFNMAFTLGEGIIGIFVSIFTTLISLSPVVLFLAFINVIVINLWQGKNNYINSLTPFNQKLLIVGGFVVLALFAWIGLIVTQLIEDTPADRVLPKGVSYIFIMAISLLVANLFKRYGKKIKWW
jgi:hypothetical protein